MLSAFTLSNNRLRQIHLETAGEQRPENPIWIDVVAASSEERHWVERIYKLKLPKPEHLRDIEASARFYEEEGEIHLRSDFLLGKLSESRSVTVAFVLSGDILFSVHEEDLPVFHSLRTRTHLQSGDIESSKDVLIDLYSMDVEFSADALEEVYADLGDVSRAVLQTKLSDKAAAVVLASIAQAEHLNGRIRRNVMDTRRAMSFLMRSKMLSPAQHEDARQIMQDIDSLDGHTSFLFDKINFLMSATVGFININQNKIVRLFSVASVALLPPMLIASIYGMNFRHMPELDWGMGYVFALGLMVLSVLLPFWLFQRKGWLK
ncbi:MAG TPA: magnesium/cobalt transporter CorA [Gallionellaceae bacterium]|nr:magnesium/cobalt transporter CorA [Gallionellaceae bacterium]